MSSNGDINFLDSQKNSMMSLLIPFFSHRCHLTFSEGSVTAISQYIHNITTFHHTHCYHSGPNLLTLGYILYIYFPNWFALGGWFNLLPIFPTFYSILLFPKWHADGPSRKKPSMSSHIDKMLMCL